MQVHIKFKELELVLYPGIWIKKWLMKSLRSSDMFIMRHSPMNLIDFFAPTCFPKEILESPHIMTHRTLLAHEHRSLVIHKVLKLVPLMPFLSFVAFLVQRFSGYSLSTQTRHVLVVIVNPRPLLPLCN